ncbi:MAG: hypothetical protein CVV03_06035 [Firmicutes bacterium HGW-Firmicutes-8]|nr:MAG: hypothetical protein CVV03_06035 [Firmicutes bacterium HGW-Firmicutes-8]
MKKALKFAVSIAGIFLMMALVIGCGNKAKTESGNNAQRGNRGEQRGMFSQRSPEETKTLLAPLVQDKTITQQQADTVAAYVYQQAEERRSQNQEERRTQWGQNDGGPRPNQQQRPDQGGGLSQDPGPNPGQRTSPLSELVQNGTITQQQSDKIAEVLLQPRGAGQTDVQ